MIFQIKDSRFIWYGQLTDFLILFHKSFFFKFEIRRFSTIHTKYHNLDKVIAPIAGRPVYELILLINLK